MNYKIIVAHPERQHSFRVASALKKSGMLCKYVTTVYNKETSLLMKLVKLVLSKDDCKRANGRSNPDLEDDDVVQFCEMRGLIQIALYRFDKSRIFYNWWHKKTSQKFGKKVAKLAIREKADAVILYDANARTCFTYLKKHAPQIKRIMDVSAANRLYMKNIYEKDMELCPQFAAKLKRERDFLWRGNYCALLQQELENTQYFLVPSAFVQNSLLYSRVDPQCIKRCPYGANFKMEKENLKSKCNSPAGMPLKAIYVGNVTEMKGIYHLLEAVKDFPPEELELTLVGAYDNTDGLFSPYQSRVNFVGKVTPAQVKERLLASDLFVFPSLGEGMSLAVLEAMACGLPCIVTENSGVSGLITNGVNGFEIPAQNPEAIKEKLQWAITHKADLAQMGRISFARAEQYTWENYDKNLIHVLQSILA